ncbi:MAG: hypothetical protein F2911_11305 [Actinobacteria bacterium]|uniref:Unannotated protein n=1 Tax=freshwater metagenome TaxID=449393 RepID=A0A6J7SIB8_9ZZZZ|nr:hypothetical protein [Actinomycetota bacterium]
MTPEEATDTVRAAINSVSNSRDSDGRHLIRYIGKLIETGAWRRYLEAGTGRLVTYAADESAKFARNPPGLGLGIDPDKLVAIIRAHRDQALADLVQDLLTPALGTVGRPSLENVRNTNIVSDRQDDATYVVGRLKRDDPNLAGQVRDGVISAHAAAIQAGIRHPYKSIRADNVDLAMRSLVRIYGEPAAVVALSRVSK